MQTVHYFAYVFTFNQTANRIYSLIDDLIADLDNAPSFRSFSTTQQSQQKSAAQSTDSEQKGRKKTKKKIKQKKSQKDQKDKPTQKVSKRATKLITSKLPPPTLIDGVKCMYDPCTSTSA